MSDSRMMRLTAVDALRGFAVMGIILLHNIEHFNFYSFPEAANATEAALNQSIWNFLFFSFSGKAYAIFALLFGFTFYLQNRNAELRGINFAPKFRIRLVALLFFGFINALFFPGEILVFYALLGWSLLGAARMSTRTLFWVAVILMLQPLEWAKLIWGVISPEANPNLMPFSLVDVYPQLGGESLWEMFKVNFVTGQLASLNWALCYGRVCQTLSLFMLGVLAGRTGLFCVGDGDNGKAARRFWTRTVFIALPATVIAYYAKEFIFNIIDGSPLVVSAVKTMLNTWYNFGFMLVMVGGFLLLYSAVEGRVIKLLEPYGRMSLTDYVSQSIIGSCIYFGYGFGLHKTCGVALSFCIGIALLVAQIAFATWWFRHYKRGPLETVWHRITWGRSRRS